MNKIKNNNSNTNTNTISNDPTLKEIIIYLSKRIYRRYINKRRRKVNRIFVSKIYLFMPALLVDIAFSLTIKGNQIERLQSGDYNGILLLIIVNGIFALKTIIQSKDCVVFTQNIVFDKDDDEDNKSIKKGINYKENIILTREGLARVTLKKHTNVVRVLHKRSPLAKLIRRFTKCGFIRLVGQDKSKSSWFGPYYDVYKLEKKINNHFKDNK